MKKDKTETKSIPAEEENFMTKNEEELYLVCEDEERVVAKYNPTSLSKIRIIQNKITGDAYAAYGNIALLKLENKKLKNCIVELREKQFEFLTELMTYNAFLISEKIQNNN